MSRKFTVDASKKVQATRQSDQVYGAKGDEPENPKMDQFDDLYSRVDDDFSYVMSGIERLGRENMLDEALDLLNSLADTLDSAISIIGDDFDTGINDSEEL